jgi:hypothetical protein
LNLLDRACFSSEELPTVIERVGRWAGSTSVAHPRADAFPAEFSDATAVGRWIDSIAGKASFEVEQEHLSYRAFRSAMKRLAPLVLRVTESAQPVFIVVVGCVGKTVVAVGRDLKRVRLDCEALRDFLFRVQRSAVLQEIEQLLKHAGVGRVVGALLCGFSWMNAWLTLEFRTVGLCGWVPEQVFGSTHVMWGCRPVLAS